MKRKHLLPVWMLLAVLGLALTTGAPHAAATPSRDAAAPNDATQARLRVSQCVLGAPAMDIYIDGKAPVDTDIPLANVGALEATRYEYLAPGTHQVAVAPAGQNLAQALLSPVDVPVVAGHRYTVVVLGQKQDASHQALVIDETAAYQAAGAKPTDSAHITVNNIKGAPGIDFYEGGVVRDSNVPYGGFKAALWPVGPFTGLKVTLSGAPDQFIDPGFADEGFNAPGIDTLDCFSGTYPGSIGQEFDAHTSPSTSTLSSIDFLRSFSGAAGQTGKYPSFNTFLGALKTAGLDQMLTTGGPYLLFAPTDQAFAALPDAARQALLADPQALADVLRAHIVAGYYPPGTLAHPGFTRTVTNLRGAPLALPPNGQVISNGVPVALDDSVMAANGTRLFWISKLLVSPANVPAAPPGMPTTGAGAGPADLLGLLGVALAVLLAGGLLRGRGWPWGADRRPTRRLLKP
jgi:hypothetical protein